MRIGLAIALAASLCAGQTAGEHYERAEDLMRNFRYSEAVSEYQQAARMEPENPFVARRLMLAQGKVDAVTLTNADVVAMLASQIGEEVILAKIEGSRCRFDTSPAALDKLKSAGASTKVMLAIIEHREPIPEKPPPQRRGCLLVKHAGTIGRRLVWTALIGVPIAPGAKFDLVDSLDFTGAKLSYKGLELQRIQEDGTRVIVLPTNPRPDDVANARQACSSQPEQTRPDPK